MSIQYEPQIEKKQAAAMMVAFDIAKLFRKDRFQIVRYAIGKRKSKPDEAKSDFEAVCVEAGIDDAHKEWLWNYFKNYSGRPGGGGTGW